jgi:glycosyltransferase involved in cell wall biosynthesis
VTAVRALIDPQIFYFQRRGGVSRYFAEVAAGITDLDQSVDLTIPLRWSPTEYLASRFPDQVRLLGTEPRFVRPRALDLANRVRCGKPGRVDVVHHTWYRPEFLHRYRTRSQVTTVHDMIPLVLPEEVRHINPQEGLRRYIEESDAIICVSETTRVDLERYWGDVGKPVHVIHHGLNEQFFGAGDRGAHVLPERYVLHVGRRAGYKNFSQLAEAFATMSSADPGLALVCVGGGPLTADETEFFDRQRLSDRVVQLGATDDELAAIYAGADAMAFPSRYEGFGMPLLEAFAAGCPTVTSNAPALVEIGAGLASVVSPDDPQALADALTMAIAENRDGPTPTVLAAREHARSFTWARCAQEHLDVYRELAGA